jgi:hypothetical protein
MALGVSCRELLCASAEVNANVGYCLLITLPFRAGKRVVPTGCEEWVRILRRQPAGRVEIKIPAGSFFCRISNPPSAPGLAQMYRERKALARKNRPRFTGGGKKLIRQRTYKRASLRQVVWIGGRDSWVCGVVLRYSSSAKPAREHFRPPPVP